MFTLYIDKEEVLNDLPFVQEWIDAASTVFLRKSIDDSKLEFYYSYGYFLPKIKPENKDEYYQNLYDNTVSLKFNERLAFEFSKVRVSLTMKLGNFIVTSRLPKNIDDQGVTILPKVISDIVTEITKVKMIVESETHENQNVKDSIPEIDTSIVSFEIIKDAVKGEYSQDFDIDLILDKISNQGFDSLSDEEKTFLDKKSKDI